MQNYNFMSVFCSFIYAIQGPYTPLLNKLASIAHLLSNACGLPSARMK
jgi:hypothetical protein